MAQYGLASYWDERYTRDSDFFDWYQKWEDLRCHISPFLEKPHKILNLGCGLSRMSESLFEDGYQNQTNIDISKAAIEKMSKHYKEKPSMEFRVMNALDMSAFPSETFDTVIDKGTMDAILCGESSTTNVAQLLKEVNRVLNRNGRYICITYGQPSFRLPYFERAELEWDVQHLSVPKPALKTTGKDK
ncbi:EEF1A lysine methyltransferase 4-like isoform X1 [Hylaeus volcanicus]|uniref:EEF1A lysine methyltransferase 4-like isoform X1 n=1 Tax=Hylaeus volcanicus TaxID=313075 RepID=UPI0023B84A00|nr:EEF1A lysine methyltransferase 4-like isoform X1 [Hylaeus volcanicus]